MESSKSTNQQVDSCSSPEPEPGKLTVYYDGACPLCRREIDFYRRRGRAAPIEWVDAAAGDAELIAPDLARTDALARFHVRLPDGTLESGSRGFGELWSVLPGFAWLGQLARTRSAQPALEAAYRGFLRVRPLAQRVATKVEPQAARPYPRWLERELRSNHAGESGAVAIYRGILTVSRCPEVRRFARRHLQTETRHLDIMQELVPPRNRSKLLPLWNVAGFIAGSLPSVFGARAVYATIEAVETFVDSHYRYQVDMLKDDDRWVQVREALESCRQDELTHRDEARQLGDGAHGMALRLWLRVVAIGSAAGVAVARRV